MPIKIPDNLPARALLEAEGLSLMADTEAARQDIRPLRIALLNLMPDKPTTERHFARLLGASPLQIELSLIQISGHAPKTTSAEHMLAFYRPWDEVRGERFDGLIVTGAPVETLAFEEVSYWDELSRIFDWSQTHVHAGLAVCWGAQAGVRHFHGVPKHVLSKKCSGVFPHANLAPASPYLRGLADEIDIPVSRWTEVRPEDLPADGSLKVLLESEESGLCLLEDARRRWLYMFNHPEYETGTLAAEYHRDSLIDPTTPPPAHYFPANDPTRAPRNRWRSHAHLLFANWLNEVYQTTPFELETIGAA